MRARAPGTSLTGGRARPRAVTRLSVAARPSAHPYPPWAAHTDGRNRISLTDPTFLSNPEINIQYIEKKFI